MQNSSIHLLSEIRKGAYYDSVILMQLQRALAGLDGVEDAGVVMGTEANKELLDQSHLLDPAGQNAANEDLIIAVRAATALSAQEALAQVDTLLTRRRAEGTSAYRPKTLATAVAMRPDADWVLISVPGRYAAAVARDGLRAGKNIFLYSDNVSLQDELSLKQIGAEKGLLVMGPDCGTAMIHGVGLGFANRVRQGSIGIVGASGTGIQYVMSRIHQLGGGLTHAIGTGGRDLSAAVGAITSGQGLDLLAQDSNTEVIVLISKPPAPQVAQKVLAHARTLGKPVVVNFIGYTPDPTTLTKAVDTLHFVATLEEAAALAVSLTRDEKPNQAQKAAPGSPIPTPQSSTPRRQFLRGLFSGGTLAYETQHLLQGQLPDVYSNTPLDKRLVLADALVSQGHTIVDLGEDEFTVGRLHPMLDNDLRIRRLHQEAADPETAVILLDVVLGDGAHPDPAGELAPAIAQAKARAAESGRTLAVIALVVGTDQDPQDLATQIAQLQTAGATVHTRTDAAVHAAMQALTEGGLVTEKISLKPPIAPHPTTNHQSPVTSHHPPLFSAINLGLESFTDSLMAQGTQVVHVEWRPPAGGNERLMALLAKMRE